VNSKDIINFMSPSKQATLRVLLDRLFSRLSVCPVQAPNSKKRSVGEPKLV